MDELFLMEIVADAIGEFLKKIGYNGMMSADFKRDPADGRLKLLDVNVRLWLHFWLKIY